MLYFFPGVSVILFIIFLVCYKKRPARIINGFWLVWCGINVLSSLIIFAVLSDNIIFDILIVMLFVPFSSVLAFGIYGLIVFLFINAVQVLKKERHTLQNMLTLMLAVAIVIKLILRIIFNLVLTEWWGNIVMAPLDVIELVMVFTAMSFFIALLSIRILKPKADTDFVVVLGCGLSEGWKVTPLLASRVDAAIKFYNAQKKYGRKIPKIIMSGGKGDDEKRAESEAMAEYAIHNGVSEEDILIENRSRDTMENMKYSKSVMDEVMPHGYKSAFATSSYHIFRARYYADKVGIANMRTLSGRTAGYFVPNAILRELVAVLAHHKISVGIINVVVLAGYVCVLIMIYS